MRVASRHAPCCNMEDARTGLVGSSRCRNEVQRSEEEEGLGRRRGKGGSIQKHMGGSGRNTWSGRAFLFLPCFFLPPSREERDHETR